MILLLPLLSTTAGVRALTRFLARRGVIALRPWSSWPAAAGAGMAVVYVCTGATHFIEPDRAGLVAIVPPFVPRPELMVTLSGLAELAIAAGLVIPRTRRWAALASIALLLALFPANVVAAGGVDHPAAPSTALLPRALLQGVFLAFSIIAAFRVARVRPNTPRRLAAGLSKQ